MENLIVLLVLMTLGYIFGQAAERRHYKSIYRREQALIDLPTTSSKFPMGVVPSTEIKEAYLVHGSVVISVDYFKRVVAGLRSFFGGGVRSYETLVDRARREAILRLKESCADAQQIINLRIETSSIHKGRKNQIGSVEVLAYGTAIYLHR